MKATDVLQRTAEHESSDSWMARFEWWRHPTLLGLERDDPHAVLTYRCKTCRRPLAGVFRAAPAVLVLVTFNNNRPASPGSHPDHPKTVARAHSAYLLPSNVMLEITITTKVTQKQTDVVAWMGCRCSGSKHLLARDVYRTLGSGSRDVAI